MKTVFRSGAGWDATVAMQPRTLKFKVVLYLTVALSVAMLFFAGMVAWYLYTEILGKVSDQVIQVSEVISKSMRFAMLQNQPAYVDTSSTTWPIRRKSTGSGS
ncbi:MAG: hypothetical protein ACLPXM_20615 [Terriglobales bacterium]